MANDKDFVVNGPVAVGKDTKVTVGTIASGAVDLSTGNYFTDSPSGDYTYTFANPGAVQSFQIEATGGSAAVASTFSTDIYDGTGASLTINNGIDLAGDDGLTWIKCRNAAEDHFLFSSLQNGSGQTLFLKSNTTGAAVATNGVSQTATGFTVPVDAMVNQTNNNYVSWTFKKQTKFFDVVTYTGDGSARSISHNLGLTPGMIIIKAYSSGASYPQWYIHHRSLGFSQTLEFTTSAAGSSSIFTASNSTTFSIGSSERVNENGQSFVAYLFAHDTASDGLIQCGSYTGNGSSDGPEINLGWQPQWLLFKRSSGVEDWIMFDNIRGMVVGGIDPDLRPNLSQAEGAFLNYLEPSATGFKLTHNNSRTNENGDTYIYMAIRSAAAPAITWPTNIEWTAGSTPRTPAEGETDVYTFTTDDGGTTYTGIQSIDNAS